MTETKQERVPRQMRPYFDAIVALTDRVCREHLNDEYQQYCRRLAAALCRKRPSPVTRGRTESWACGIAYALGSVNFLFDKSQSPHLSASELCKLFGVGTSTGAAKASEIRDLFAMDDVFDPTWVLPSMMAQSPFGLLSSMQEFILPPPDVVVPFGPLGGASPASGRMMAERALQDVSRALGEQEFDSIDDANAFLEKLLADPNRPLAAPGPLTPLQRAQDLMYDAWEAVGPKRVKLAREALRISPDCADAYVLLAEETARTPHDQLRLYQDGVAAGERALRPEGIEAYAGEFWGVLKTRPYMRARAGLALCLWELGRRQEAIECQTETLRLNPNDNQGLRYVQLAWLLEVGQMEQVKQLLDQYADDGAASWEYGRALYEYRVNGPYHSARSTLKQARKANRFVPAYLLGQKPMPEQPPEYISFGDESEAIECAYEQRMAWLLTAGALDWLARA
jgi:tetratricopeptide (TPR) repeat protein